MDGKPFSTPVEDNIGKYGTGIAKLQSLAPARNFI